MERLNKDIRHELINLQEKIRTNRLETLNLTDEEWELLHPYTCSAFHNDFINSFYIVNMDVLWQYAERGQREMFDRHIKYAIRTLNDSIATCNKLIADFEKLEEMIKNFEEE